MNRKALEEQIFKKQSLLCVGIDPVQERMPARYQDCSTDSLIAFSKTIIETVSPFAIAIKPNIAYFEAFGSSGWDALPRIAEMIKDHNLLSIADAKRGDIGKSSKQYAKAFFETMDFDAITLSPLMGYDSIAPFLYYKDKWSILLTMTSNPGSKDFLEQELVQGQSLGHHILSSSQQWPNAEKLMYVVGATKPDELKALREKAHEAIFLVPGVGAQGGSVAEVIQSAGTARGGLLINSTRSIIYSDLDADFQTSVRLSAEKMQKECALNITLTN